MSHPKDEAIIVVLDKGSNSLSVGSDATNRLATTRIGR